MTDETTVAPASTEGKAPAQEVAPVTTMVTESAPAPVETAPSTDPNPTQQVPMATDPTAVTIPEGLDVGDEAMQNFLGVLDNAELSSADRASSLLAINAESIVQAQEGVMQFQQDQFMQTQEEWRTAINNDPELGGIHLPETTAKIAEVLDKFGTPEVRQAFDVTGAGNHPEIVRFLANIGALISEGGQVSGSPADAPQTQAQRMFGNT